MSRPFTVTILKPDGSAWNGGKFTISLREGFAGVDEVVSPYTIEYTLDTNGQIATQPIALETPPTGTAHYLFGEPGGEITEAYIETGAAVDYSTLKTVASAAVDQDDLQTLLDAAERFHVTVVTTTYAAQVGDVYLRCTGAPYTVTLPPASDYADGEPFFVKNKSTSAYLSIAPNGTNTIDGSTATRTIMPTWGAGFVSDGVSDWDIVGGVA